MLSSCLIRRLDFFLTFISVICNYTMPFFLKSVFICCCPTNTDSLISRRILDAIDMKDSTKESKSRAYIYALLAFTFSICKVFYSILVGCSMHVYVHLQAQADVHHLWYGRRAASRMRSELMAAIYDKALKRKDFSGIIGEKQKTEAAEKAAAAAEASGPRKHVGNLQVAIHSYFFPEKSSKEKKKAEKEKAAKADDPKAGADVGKIVNLMANDANRVRGMHIRKNIGSYVE